MENRKKLCWLFLGMASVHISEFIKSLFGLGHSNVYESGVLALAMIVIAFVVQYVKIGVVKGEVKGE